MQYSGRRIFKPILWLNGLQMVCGLGPSRWQPYPSRVALRNAYVVDDPWPKLFACSPPSYPLKRKKDNVVEFVENETKYPS
jgi:hypothetical protein